jgi:SpoIIAA-like
MIERLKESGGWAYGFKVVGRVTEEDVKAFEPQMEVAIRERGKRPLGIVIDATEFKDMDWSGRREELRFLHKYSDHIARVALVGASKWEEVKAMLIGATVLAEADIRYFEAGEMPQAWQWAKRAKHAEDVPVRQIYRGGIWRDYQEEFSL